MLLTCCVIDGKGGGDAGREMCRKVSSDGRAFESRVTKFYTCCMHAHHSIVLCTIRPHPQHHVFQPRENGGEAPKCYCAEPKFRMHWQIGLMPGNVDNQRRFGQGTCHFVIWTVVLIIYVCDQQSNDTHEMGR